MSVAMAQGLNALISLNNDMTTLGTEATSGKKINSAADGLAAYLSAKSYSQRSDRLQSVNDTLSTNLQTVKAAQTGLDSIRSTISDTLDTLKAASQTQSFVAATNATNTAAVSQSSTQIGLAFTIWNATQTAAFTPAQIAVTDATALCPTAGPTAGDVVRLGGQNLSVGQTFSINGTSIQVGAQTAVAGGAGTAANPTVVTTVGQLVAAIRGAIGAPATVANPAVYNGGVFVLSGSSNGTNTTTPNAISIAQTAQGTAATASNISAMFAAGRAAPANAAANYTSDDASAVTTNNGLQSFTIGAMDHTISGGTNGQTADSRRAAAAKSYKLAIDQIGQYLKSASVSGTNLLNGDSLKVTFDEKGNSTTLQVQDANNNALKFDATSLGFLDQTGAATDAATNFQVNDDPNNAAGATVGLNTAINKLTNALSTLSLGDAQVAQFQSTVSNRVDFNKSIIGLLGDAGNALTAADMTQVSTQYAADQVQQGFAQSILSSTKQSDQSIVQLLR
jgi:flagellin-like hook-associated protein FlgL